jgi:hypothetical protein
MRALRAAHPQQPSRERAGRGELAAKNRREYLPSPDDARGDEAGEPSAERGWVCVHRRLKDRPRYHDSEYVHLWLHLYLCATHKARQVLFDGKTVTLQPGQLITGRFSLASATGIHPSKVERVLQWLEIEQEIEQRGSNKNRLITLLSWPLTQQTEQRNGQQPDTNNNGNNAKGGALYVGLRKSFELRKKEGVIKDFIAGEDFSIFNDTVLTLLEAVPELRGDPDLGATNEGVTILWLK